MLFNTIYFYGAMRSVWIRDLWTIVDTNQIVMSQL